MKKRPLIILTGPTAVGKTAASIGLAKAVGGEIISADSMQVYRQMDIGSAKITKDEMQGIPHYLVDVLDPEEAFNVVRFQELAKEAMEEIFRNGHIPIVVGGTGFYIQALLYDIDFTENDSDLSFREELEKKAGEDGLPVPPYAIYNIGNNQPENLLDFVDILQQELIRAGVLPEDYDFEAHKKLVPMQPGDVPVTYADTSALERDFGFKPSTSLREGLRRFAQWYKEFYIEGEKER